MLCVCVCVCMSVLNSFVVLGVILFPSSSATNPYKSNDDWTRRGIYNDTISEYTGYAFSGLDPLVIVEVRDRDPPQGQWRKVTQKHGEEWLSFSRDARVHVDRRRRSFRRGKYLSYRARRLVLNSKVPNSAILEWPVSSALLMSGGKTRKRTKL